MEFWKEGLFLFTNNGVIWSKSGYYAHKHILLLTNSNYIINYTGHIKLKEKYIFSFYSMCHISIIIWSPAFLAHFHQKKQEQLRTETCLGVYVLGL